MIAFRIGGSESEYVSVAILRDNGDGWFTSEVRIAVGAFRGSYAADIDYGAFSDFLAELEALNKSLSGSATFTSSERQLELTLTCNDLGHMRVNGEAMDVAGTGNRLVFSLEIDQTDLPPILKELRKVPVKGPRRAV